MDLVTTILLSIHPANIPRMPSIIQIITHEAMKENIDPQLAIAIAKVESSLKPNAIGQHGEIGIYQLKPEYHNVKPGDYWQNIRVGLKYLRSIKEKCNYYPDDSWIVCFNRGENRFHLKHPTKFAYYLKVKSKQKHLLSRN